MRPNPLIRRAYVLRGARLWFGTRALVSAILFLAGLHPLRLPIHIVVVIVLVSVSVCFVDCHRHRERVLLGNLGIGSRLLIAMFVVPALLGESLLWAGGTVLP